MKALARAVAALAIAAAPAGAQSLFNSAGLGLPLEALDGRARALGSFGVGLRDPVILPSDPASPARLVFPSGVITVQPSWVDMTQDGVDDHQYFRGSRFPLLGMAYPVLGGTFVLHLSSVLDQHYEGERPLTVSFPSGDVGAVDRFTQDGSLSSLAVGYARMIGARTAVGVHVGRYSGSVLRRLVREFETPPGSGQLDPYVAASRWRYSGYSVSAGISADLPLDARVAASGTWSTELDADATGSTEGADRSFSLPLELRLGASVPLTPGLVMSAGMAWSDWSKTADDLGPGVDADATLGYGIGLELVRARLFNRNAPLRFGFKRRELPFSPGTGGATEQSFTGGLALNLSQAGETILASTDIGVERGKRTGGGYTEEFWRATVSISLSSF